MGDASRAFPLDALDHDGDVFIVIVLERERNVRRKLEHAQTIEPADVELARDAVRRWREYRPPVDLYVTPVLGVDLPPADVDELEVRIPLTAFLRPFNVLGWAGLAIGDLQLVAPRDEVVLAAGLAWERAG